MDEETDLKSRVKKLEGSFHSISHEVYAPKPFFPKGFMVAVGLLTFSSLGLLVLFTVQVAFQCST